MNRKYLITNLLAAALICGVSPLVSAADLEEAGSLMMDHAMEDLMGQAVSLEDFRGDVLVVNFWASWCAPCLRELPVLDRWNSAWRDAGARVIAVSIDNKAQNAREYIEKEELGLTVLVDGPDGLARKLDLPAVPTSFVVDTNGRVVLRVEGSSAEDLEKMHHLVQSLLGDAERGPEA